MTIFLTIVRAIFVLMTAAIGWAFVVDAGEALASKTWLALAIGVSIGLLVVFIDLFSPARRKLALLAGTFFGLIVGVIAGYAMSFIVALLVGQLAGNSSLSGTSIASLTSYIQLLVYCASTYFAISLVLQTKDDFRFIVPFVEFRKQTRGARPLLLDTSVLIDGRVAAVAESGVFESQLIVPGFVIQELQSVADSPDRQKRNRGRRGLDVMSKLQKSTKIDLITYETGSNFDLTVDQRLVQLAKELEARVVTTDYNLNKVAILAGIDVINLNELAVQLRPEALPGERMTVRIIKPGETPGQGVGYLEDGTMVVVEQARSMVNEEVEFTVTNTVQTNAGKMVFGRLGDSAPHRHPRGEAVAPRA
jgi:uncharacterized protein YacL